MAIIEIAKIQVRRGQENTTQVPQLAPGEFGWAQDTENLYIGKRIAEGANSDENSRILSQKDYDNLFALVMGAGRTAIASTSTYRYRDNLDYSVLQSTTTFIATKLDAFVSLTDFGVTPSSTATDIYQKLTLAVQNLFSNIYINSDARRELKIPAGNYYLSDTVNLPPYASLVGEGPGMTNIISLNNDKPLFRTVDADGNYFSGPTPMQSSNKSSRYVKLKGITFAYTTSTAVTAPLVSFDNTENSVIEDTEFTVFSLSTSTIGTVLLNTSTIYGTGISLRGLRASGVEQNKNVTISNCSFKNIGLGVLATGSVAFSVIEQSVFSELQQGINFSALNGDVNGFAPTDAVITNNKFDVISKQAIFVGTSTNLSTGPNFLNHKSSFNKFNKIGNGTDVGDNVSNSTGKTAVITCFGQGFNSVNDTFSRKNTAFTTTNVSFFYVPLVEGNVLVDCGTVTEVKTLSTGTQQIDKLFASDKTVSYKIPYTLSDLNNLYYSRSGSLTVTVNAQTSTSAVASGSVSDYYDYSYDSDWPVVYAGNTELGGDLSQPVLSVQAGLNKSYLNLINTWAATSNTATQLVLKYQVNIIS